MNDCGTEKRHWQEGIELFNKGLAYESHEEFEHVWLKSTGKKKLFLQILILIAAVQVHRAKGR
ncbi:DUF309 domain-containing protein, partial [bacterium]|nr:DUF309 domain-containing protein [bacterium]